MSVLTSMLVLQATNAVWLPWNALHIAGYEEAKRMAAAARALQSPEQLPPWALGACSAGWRMQLGTLRAKKNPDCLFSSKADAQPGL